LNAQLSFPMVCAIFSSDNSSCVTATLLLLQMEAPLIIMAVCSHGFMRRYMIMTNSMCLRNWANIGVVTVLKEKCQRDSRTSSAINPPSIGGVVAYRTSALSTNNESTCRIEDDPHPIFYSCGERSQQ
jgi:hypothetical protein